DQILVEIGFYQFWRTRWANRYHASGISRAAPLDFRKTFSACTQLLHVVARARGTTTGYLYWLVNAPNQGRCYCRIIIYIAFTVDSDTAVLVVYHLWASDINCRYFLRHKTSGCSDCGASRAPDWLAQFKK